MNWNSLLLVLISALLIITSCDMWKVNSEDILEDEEVRQGLKEHLGAKKK